MAYSENEKIRIEIIALFKGGKTMVEISALTGKSYSTIRKIVARWKKTNTTDRKPGSGRKKALNSIDLSIIKTKISENPRLSTSKLATIVNETANKGVHKETIRRYLHRENLISAVAAVKPLLTTEHVKRRFDICTKWSRWPMKHWKQVIFSDESRFTVFQNDGKVKIWREAGSRYEMKNCVPSVKHGNGGVMVWGCIGYNGVGLMTIVDGIIDSVKYTRILSTCLDGSIDKLGISGEVVFQQDNAPVHTSKYTREYFEYNEITVMEWPPQSPDLNSIEHVWSYIEKELQKTEVRNKLQLINKINEIWSNIPVSYIKKLYDSIPKRIEMVIRNNGGHIPY